MQIYSISDGWGNILCVQGEPQAPSSTYAPQLLRVVLYSQERSCKLECREWIYFATLTGYSISQRTSSWNAVRKAVESAVDKGRM